MRIGTSLAIACVVVGASVVGAQDIAPPPPPEPIPSQAKEVVPLPSPDPARPNNQNTPPNIPNPQQGGYNQGSTPPPQGGPGGYPQGGPGGYPPGPGGYPQGPGGYPPGPGGYPQGPGGYPPPYPPPGAYPPPFARPFLPGDPASNPNFWVSLEALAWWGKNQPLPIPVVTTGPASQGANAGGLGMPGTVSLNQPLNFGAAGGFRLDTGAWFDPLHKFGVDVSFLVLGQQSAGFSVFDRSGAGATVINEPVSGAPFFTQVSAPGIETGNVVVHSQSNFWGAEVNGLYNLYRDNGWTFNLVGGFRYLQLNEELNINANSELFTTTTYTDNVGNVLVTAPPGSTVNVYDQFTTHNNFYGGNVGLQAQYGLGRWFFTGAGKLAIGATQESVSITGNTYVNPSNGTPVTLNGGNYATLQQGTYSISKFAVAPEFQINAGYQFTPFIRGMIGYNFLFLSSVMRPGNQIDNTYDGMVHPIVPMASSTYWTQGINFKLIFSF